MAASGGGVNPLHTIGALTRPSAGARVVGSGLTNGTYETYWTISGGTTLARNATAGTPTPGTYSMSGVTITVEANVYDVGTGELAAVLALGSATIDGKTIKGLPGADIGATTAGGTPTDFASTLAFSTGLTITSRDTDNQCYLRRAYFRFGGPVTLSYIKGRDNYVLADDYEATAMWRFTNNASGRSQLTIDHCDVYSQDLSGLNTATLVSGTSAAHTGGVSTTTITLTNSPDLSGVLTDRSMALRLGSSNLIIVGVNNGTKTVTVNQAQTIAAGSPASYKICYTPQSLSLFGQDGSITNLPDLTITNSTFRDSQRSLMGLQCRNLNLTGNTFDNVYQDHLQLVVGGTTAVSTLIERNLFLRCAGSPLDPLNPHIDCIQFVQLGMTNDNTAPIQIRGNTFWSGNGRAYDNQAIFIEGTPVARKVLVEVEHNVIMMSSYHAISIDRPKTGSKIRGNTVLYDNTGTGLIPAIDMKASAGADEAGVLVENNVSPTIAYTLSNVYDNYEFGATAGVNDANDYAALLVGTSTQIVATNMTSATDLRTYGTPDTTTLWPTGRVKRGAMSGYYDYATGTEDAPWDETGWAASGSWGDLTGQTQSAAVTSSKRQVTSVSVTGTQVRVTGGTTPTLTLYDTDGTSVIVSGVTSVCAMANQYVEIHDTASATGSTMTTVTVTAGAAAPGSWNITTAAGAYSINAVEFDGTNDWLAMESGFSSTGSKKLLVAYNVRFPGGAPTTGTQLVIATSGGNAQITVGYLNTGALNIAVRDSSGTAIALFLSNNNVIKNNTWQTVLIGLDTTTAGTGWQVYVRDSGGSWGAAGVNSSSITADATTASATRCRVGATTGGASKAPQHYIADLYARLDTTLDLSNSTNRDLFLPTVDKGSDGSTPTGTAPPLYLSGATASWHTNDGTGGGVTLNGTLTTAPSAPS